MLIKAYADIKSNTSQIDFDVNNDGQADMTINTNGLGVGTSSPTGNLHVIGNVALTDGELTVGSTSSGNSTLQINGTLGFGVQSISANATAGDSSFILSDTSSDNILITLPYAGNVMGRQYSIKKVTSDNKLWVSGGGNAIDDIGSLELGSSTSGFPYLSVVSDGSQWRILSSSSGVQSIGADNLIGWWRLDESSGNTASDSSGQGNDGTLHEDAFTFSTNSTEGRSLKALLFNGSDDYVDTGDFNQDIASGYTISAWVKILSSKSQLIYNRDSSSGPNSRFYQFSVTGAEKINFLRFNSSNSLITNITSTPTINIGQWHHVVGRFDSASGSSVFIDSVLGASDAVTTANKEGTGIKATIGARFSGGSTSLFFDGSIDDVRLYDRALTNIEIQALFQTGE